MLAAVLGPTTRDSSSLFSHLPQLNMAGDKFGILRAKERNNG
jgi:hypothetical protein